MMSTSPDFSALLGTLQRRIAAGLLPGAVVWVQRGASRDSGQPLLAQALGAQAPGGPPMQLGSVFRLYSMTKPVVSLAALMLVEQGRLLLTDPVCRWLPAFAHQRVLLEGGALAPVQRDATVHDLLRHTAGLSYAWEPGPIQHLYHGADIGSRELTNAEFARALGPLPLVHQPGSAWAYSRATDVLGALLEVVADAPLGELLEAMILRPLGMGETGFHARPALHGRLAEPFEPVVGELVSDTLNDVRAPVPFESGGGGLVGTAADYARFCALLLAGGTLEGVRLASRKTIGWMAADHLGAIPVADAILPAGYGFGLGVAVRQATGLAARNGSVGSYGWSGKAGTLFFIDPQEDLFALVLTQAPAQLDALCDLLPNGVYGAL